MKTIWIDLTDIEKWNGNHGGIQRVVYGLAKQFYLAPPTGTQVKYFVYDEYQNAFYESNFSPIYERVEPQKGSLKTNVSPTPSLKKIIKHRLKRHIPLSVQRSKVARSVLDKYSPKVMAGARRSKSVIKKLRNIGRSKSHHTNASPAIFKKDDTVLILGKPWDNLNIQKLLSEQKRDIGFTLGQVVYDLIISLYPHLHHPSLFEKYTQHMFEAITASDFMMPISQSSARDLRKFCEMLSLPIPKIQVIRLGDEITEIKDGIKLEKPDIRIEDNFIACVGTVEIRKNHMLLYYAYKLAAERGIELPQLVIVGSRGWLSGDFQYLVEHDPQIRKKILLLDQINDLGLVWIYKNCLFTVYPSMYEGWGLPIAESLSYGKVCIASNTSSMPEIAGDLLDYFSPYDVDTCLRLLLKYRDHKTCEDKEKLIQAKYVKTTWAETFKIVKEYLLAGTKNT